jgi:hypothetical protein
LLQRPETRGIRIQLELLKAKLALPERGVEATLVVFGGARVCKPIAAQMELDQASRNDHSAAIEAAGRLLQLSAPAQCPH